MIDKKEINTQPLIDYFEQILSLNDIEKQFIEGSFSCQIYDRKQFVLRQDDICKHLSFVVHGCLRMYKVDEKANVHIVQFAVENQWITDLDSFYNHTASPFYIEALEKTVVLQITYERLTALYTKLPKFDRIFRVLIENAYIQLQNRLLLTISLTGMERYTIFCQQHPQLLNRLPNTQIASFLGITPEFLSKIRRKILKPGKK